jgi:hypothetical protein
MSRLSAPQRLRRLLSPGGPTNPVFYPEQLRLHVGDERADRAFEDPDSLDLLTWNIFASLDTHSDPEWLAYRMQALGGAGVTAPARIALWSGRDREPLLRPSHAYLAAARQRSQAAGGNGDSLAEVERPVEVPVRIESPRTLVLVDVLDRGYPGGTGGRDRLIELIDAGLDHARRLSSTLAVAVIYPSGTQAGRDASARLNELRDPANLAAQLAHRATVPTVLLREVSWQRLISTWEQEISYLHLSGQPVKAFLELASRRGLR